MKNVLLLSIVLWTIVLPTFADLTPQDLDKIRSIVKEEVDPIKAEIKTLDTRLQNVEQGISWMRGKLEGVDRQFEGVDRQFEGVGKQISHVTNVTYGLIALIVLAVGIPQILIAWRSKMDRAQGKRIEELSQEIERLKQQRIVKP